MTRILKIIKSGNKIIEKLTNVILKLINEEKLPVKNRDHKLIGDYTNFRECHISPDWLLIYKIDGNDIFLPETEVMPNFSTDTITLWSLQTHPNIFTPH